MTDKKTGPRKRGLRALGVYLALVVVPVLLAVVLLTGFNGRSPAISGKVVSGHPLAQLLLAAAVVVALCKAVGWLASRVGQPVVIGEIGRASCRERV